MRLLLPHHLLLLGNNHRHTGAYIEDESCYFEVAIISNVQNVRLQRRHRPTDDASTR